MKLNLTNRNLTNDWINDEVVIIVLRLYLGFVQTSTHTFYVLYYPKIHSTLADTFYVYVLYYSKIHSTLADCDADKGTYWHAPYPCPLGWCQGL